MPETYRVLVTGSRDWSDEKAVYGALNEVLARCDRPLVVVHGACPSGADDIADTWGVANVAINWPVVSVERHPAIWRPDGIYDPSAGFRRNALMVAEGADVMLAFVMPCSKPGCRQPQPHGSHGASHCAGLAEKAGIETRRFTA